MARKNPPCSFYLDLGWLGEYWNCWPGKGRVYHHTAPVNTLYGLREGLALVAEEGLENCWRRHRLCADHLHSGLVEISGGLGPTAGKVWRIGVMGNNANIKTVSKVLDALKEALSSKDV